MNCSPVFIDLIYAQIFSIVHKINFGKTQIIVYLLLNVQRFGKRESFRTFVR